MGQLSLLEQALPRAPSVFPPMLCEEPPAFHGIHGGFTSFKIRTLVVFEQKHTRGKVDWPACRLPSYWEWLGL